jgi:hypothetical protein
MFGEVQRAFCVAVVLILGSLLRVSTASAEGRSSARKAETKEYRSAVSEALREFDLGHWDEALALFERAHATQPNARTLRGIGFCLFEMRRYVSAVEVLEHSMSETRNPLTAEQEDSTRALLDRARGFVAHLPLQLVPGDGELRVDGAPQSLPDGQLRLDPGEHELVLNAPGHEPGKLHVQVKSGTNPPLEFRLTLIKPEPEPSAQVSPGPLQGVVPAAAATKEGRTRLKRGLVIGGFSLAGVSAVTLAVAGGLALKQSKALKGECPNDSCPEDQRDELDRTDRLVLVSNVAIGTIAAGAVLGLVGLFLPKRGADHAPALGALLGPHQAALQLSGRF